MKIPGTVEVLGERYNVNTYADMIYGVVGQCSDDEALSVHVRNGLLTAFGVSPYVVLTFNGLTISAFFCQHYFIFNSHARNTAGESDPDGTSVLLCVSNFEELISYIERQYRNQQFNMAPLPFSIRPRHTIQRNIAPDHDLFSLTDNWFPVSNSVMQTALQSVSVEVNSTCSDLQIPNSWKQGKISHKQRQNVKRTDVPPDCIF